MKTDTDSAGHRFAFRGVVRGRTPLVSGVIAIVLANIIAAFLIRTIAKRLDV